MRELNHLHIELSGMNLIEASAGTGKTYAIACLYLRLLIELKLPPERILVVTYTEAATKELRGRIRARIREALIFLERGEGGDPFLTGLGEKLSASADGVTGACELLEQALCCFDTASIFTIHAFCLRALQDNAFESGSAYETELAPDRKGLLKEIADDFWRSRFFREPAPLLRHALNNGFSGDYCASFLAEMCRNPGATIEPWFDEEEIEAMEADACARYGEVAALWRERGAEIKTLLTESPGLSRAADTYRLDLLPELFDAMDRFVADGNPYDLFPAFGKFTTSTIGAGTKSKKESPSHRFFDSCQRLADTAQRRLLALRVELICYCREEEPLRKRERAIRFFDDLLGDLHDALQGDSGPRLAATLRHTYSAALIDEFQDTDPLQYAIFRTIYGEENLPLFLIGDPKQAIYSFRGADIHAYLRAGTDVDGDKRFTLTANWRSTPRLLHAFNTVFDNENRPFVYERICYHPLTSGKGETADCLVVEGERSDGLQLWLLPPDEKGKPLSIGDTMEQTLRAVVAEISRLVALGRERKALIGERALAPQDIAVIVRSHYHAGLVQDALRAQGIPCVMRSDESVFDAGEAAQLLTLLRGVAEPGTMRRVRAALVTNILGRSGDDIAHLNDDEAAGDACLELFRELHRLWLERGFMVMARTLMAREGVRGRLLRYPDGERRLTNLLHCLELVQGAVHEHELGMEATLNWLNLRINGHEGDEEYQVRLETDELAVRIVTVHVSKGLEYPVVFCPFLWGGVRGGAAVVTCHDGDELVKDFGSPEFERRGVTARREELAENLRLLYVALTRARYRGYLCVGRVVDKTRKNLPETSALAYLLHATGDTRNAADLVTALAADVSALSHSQIEAHLRALAERGEGSIMLDSLPEDPPECSGAVSAELATEPVARQFQKDIASDWRVTSFTAFASRSGGQETPDRDETGAEEQPVVATERERSVPDFPRGAKTGIFFHGVFEALDFTTADDDRIRNLVAAGLEKYGFERDWLGPVSQMVRSVLTTPLSVPGGEFTLSQLEPGRCLRELEFFFPLRFITSGQLAELLARWGRGACGADLGRLGGMLDFKPVGGMVRGFMDLVFLWDGRYYLLDWKSNHLGSRSEDYGPEALQRSMESHLYPLQYLLYTVALNRYLSLRVPGYDYDTHFGGVLYLFLRGMCPERGERSGVYRDRPPRALIDDMSALLMAVQEGAE